jgi:1-deoxy-D-xylulose-5-phosphate reductoisomerase
MNTSNTESKPDEAGPSKKNVIILGSTGSIGVNALDVCRKYPEHFRVTALACNLNTGLLSDQIREFGPAHVSVGVGARVGNTADRSTRVWQGETGLLEMIKECKADIVVNGISGAKGLLPSVASIESGKTLALANKETIVMAGSIVMKMARERNVTIVPVDSEHSGLFQLIGGIGRERITELTITASGGAIRDVPVEKLSGLTVEEVLKHPTWSMGKKITVDSATGANKGLEIIEAHHLFNMPTSQIKVLVHPQSLIHALVRTCDGYLYMQASQPDMRMAIHHALFYPEFRQASYNHLDLAGKDLRFLPLDEKKYRMVGLGYQAVNAGDAYAIVFNAANEVAVQGFFDHEIRFTDIPVIVEETLAAQWENLVASIGDVIETDAKAREASIRILINIRKG